MTNNTIRHLGMPQRDHRYWLNLMSSSHHVDAGIDYYNHGELFDRLENQVASLLNKPQAMFFNKGTTCQLATLKTICEHRNNPHVALHPQSHIAFDEDDAYIQLMNLKGQLLGHTDKPLVVRNLQQLTTKPAVLIVELPLRRGGYKLPTWQQLLEMRAWCEEHKVHFHMDGARLWESAPHYQRSLAEIAELFDSVYVSLYKGIGATSGAVLAGSKDFLDACQVWRNRLGSNMYTTFPVLVSALYGLEFNLPQIPSWVVRAKEIATALKPLDDLTVDQPQTNGFQIRTSKHITQLNTQLTTLSQQKGLQICRPFAAVPDSDALFTEINIGVDHASITTQEIVTFFQTLLKN